MQLTGSRRGACNDVHVIAMVAWKQSQIPARKIADDCTIASIDEAPGEPVLQACQWPWPFILLNSGNIKQALCCVLPAAMHGHQDLEVDLSKRGRLQTYKHAVQAAIDAPCQSLSVFRLQRFGAVVLQAPLRVSVKSIKRESLHLSGHGLLG